MPPPLALDANFYATQQGRVNIKRPTEIACFSRDKDLGIYPLSDQSLKFYYPPFFRCPHTPPRLPRISLSDGYHKFTKVDDTANEHLDSLLDTLEAVERKEGSKTDVNIITWRGMITKILTSLYDTEEDWEMRCVRFDGAIFVEENHASKLARKTAQGQQMLNRRGPGPPADPKLFEYWGYRFETIAMLKKPVTEVSRDEIQAREQETTDNAEQYCSIVATEIGNHKLVMAGEVDGVMGYKPDDPTEPARWVELKTVRLPTSAGAAKNYGKKLLKFWAQSYLIGCQTIIMGCRDQDGYLTELRQVQTRDLPTEWKQIGAPWDANSCLRAAADVFDFLKANILEDDKVWLLRRSHQGGQHGRSLITLSPISDTGESDGGIVKESFRAWRKELAGRQSA